MVEGFLPLPTCPVVLKAKSASMGETHKTATYVYVFNGRVIPSLAPRYQGPNLVLSWRAETKWRCYSSMIEWLKHYNGKGPVEVAQHCWRWPSAHNTTALSPMNPGTTSPTRQWWSAEAVGRLCQDQPPFLWSRGCGGEHLQWRAQWKKRCYIHTNYFGNVYERNQPIDRQEIWLPNPSGFRWWFINSTCTYFVHIDWSPFILGHFGKFNWAVKEYSIAAILKFKSIDLQTFWRV
jgi:hypothetical protein